MIRMNFTLTDKHREKLEKEAANEGIRMSELLRKILDYYFSRKTK